MKQNNYCVAEYSHSQQKFHCDFLSVSLERNKHSVEDNKPSDWITLGIFKSWEETQVFIEKLKKQLKPNK